MSWCKKIGVSAVFATGLLACGVSTARLIYRFQNYQSMFTTRYPDGFWISMPSYGLAVAEINLGIVCACVPICFPLLKSFTEAFGSWTQYLRRLRGSSNQNQDLEKGATPTVISLPRVTQVNLRTLLSIFRAPNSSQNGNSQRSATAARETDAEDSSYTEIESVDMEYHNYLANGRH
ncbi:hypothetical protein PG995_005565 [Apiospora arundinis]